MLTSPMPADLSLALVHHTFIETVTATDGSTTQGSITEAHAYSLLRTALRRGYRTEATRTGGITITRDMATGYPPAPHHRVVVLEPLTPVGPLSPTAREHLMFVAEYAPRGRTSMEVGGRITAGMYSIPPGAATRLRETGLVLTTGGRPRVSLVAHLALIAQAHVTATRAPAGYVRPADIGMTFVGRNTPAGGLTYDRTSCASCSCREFSRPSGSRDEARRHARTHRERVTRAALAAL